MVRLSPNPDRKAPVSDSEERKAAERAASIKKLEDSFNPVGEAAIQAIVARSRKIAYDAHIAAGFTAEQTLTLIK